jgi:ubiquinone/menaquinone biosynthesis C-methylase UbiE
LEESWQEVWERKGARSPKKETYTADDLFAANGYDTPLGATGNESRERMVKNIVDALRPGPGKSLLDAGCGAGAFLSMLRETGAALAGVDYSTSLVETARRALPGLDIRVAEAALLPFPDSHFDAVLSNGVFLYFRDMDYAAKALNEMLRVCRPAGRILIADIADLGKKERCLEARRAAGASLTPPHLYYPKSFFEKFAAEHALGIEVFDQNIPGYANTPFRFNVVLSR